MYVFEVDAAASRPARRPPTGESAGKQAGRWSDGRVLCDGKVVRHASRHIEGVSPQTAIQRAIGVSGSEVLCNQLSLR